ncbi:MAG TPA: hypothetical protein VFA67_11760 [Candidatus Sulfotelmatobacter sp.]|nr:hypothetical protein [Candidatus Sulfotelmatobacter sp.]
MELKSWALALAFLSTPLLAQACPAGTDCQTGTMSGPFTAAQVAENTTTAPFPICTLTCTSGSWTGLSVEGIDAQQNVGGAYQFYDMAPNLDENIAVGPTVTGQNAQVVEWVNGAYIQAFDKVSGRPIFTNTSGGSTAVPQNVSALWSATSQPECQGNTAGNVQVIYDRLDKVYAISRRVSYTASNGVKQYAWCVAASSSSDLSNPNTKWYAYEYKMSSVIPCVPSSSNCSTGTNRYYFPDWPRFATWSNGFYITFDLQDPTSGYVESGIEACQLDRASIVRGAPSQAMKCYAYLVSPTQRPSLIHSLDAADIDSPTLPPSGEPEYFLSIVNPSNAQQGQSGLHYCTSQSTLCYSNQLALFTWGSSGLVGPKFISVNPYTPGCYNTSAANQETNTYCIPEPSTNTSTIGPYGSRTCGNYFTPCLDSLGDRMANRLAYNNLSSTIGGAYLTAAHVVMENASNQRTGIRYYILKPSSGNVTVSVNSGGSGPADLQDSSGRLYLFMPSVALDKNGNLGITYNTSSTISHPAIRFDVLPHNALTFDLPHLIMQGSADQMNTNRWGQYAATVLDPSDNLTFYGVGEYFTTNQAGSSNCTVPASNCYTWRTRIFRGEYGLQF